MKKLFTLTVYFFNIFCLSNDLKVYYVNVGQGDCIYIEFPDGKNMLIDGGPDRREEISNPVISFLKAKKVSKINYMLLSHPHSDHLNGLYAVLKIFDVERVYDTGVDNTAMTIDDDFRDLAKRVPGRYMLVSSTGPLSGFSASSVTITVLHTNTIVQSDLNNNSIVVKVSFTNFITTSTFIFGGDATGSTVEKYLVEKHGTGIQSDCYKVHHHGSGYSSYDSTKGIAFLNNLNPKYVFIQVGKNTYGHPAMETINRVAQFSGYQNIYRNDQHGTIFVKTSGDKNYQVQTNYTPITDESVEQPIPFIQPEFVIVEARNNIFNPNRDEKAYISYTMDRPGEIKINIYTLFGELIKSDEYHETRTGLVTESNWFWDGRDETNQLVSPGVYLLHIQTPHKVSIKKVVVIR